MAFLYALDPSTPLGTESAKQGDDRIREAKGAIRERLASFFVDVDVDPLVPKPGSVPGSALATAYLQLTGGTMSGSIVSTVTDAVMQATAATTSRRYVHLGNTGNHLLMGIEQSTAGATLSNSFAYEGIVRSGAGLAFSADASVAHWRISTAGHLLAGTDNSYDIGAASSSRPRHVFAGSTVRATTFDFNSGGTANIQANTTYVLFADPDGGIALHLGGTTDAANYYNNTSHYFRSRGGVKTYAQFADGAAYFNGSVIAKAAAGGSVAITTDGAYGSAATPLPMTLDFWGYLQKVQARIQAVDMHANYVYSELKFSLRNNLDALAEMAVMRHTGLDLTGIAGYTLGGEPGKLRIQKQAVGEFGFLSEDNGWAKLNMGVLAPNNSILFGADNAYDIGTLGANRPRHLFLAGNVRLSNTAALQAYTSGGVLVNLVALTADTNNITRFYSGVDAGGFQWTNQGASASWASLTATELSLSTHLRFTTDNANDIGSSAASRPRHVYVAGNVKATSFEFNTGAANLQASTTYLLLQDASGATAAYLGGTADPANYFDNTMHRFRARGGGTVFATLEAAYLRHHGAYGFTIGELNATARIRFGAIAAGYFDFITAANVRAGLICAGIDVGGHALPSADNSYDLGTSSLRWRSVYASGRVQAERFNSQEGSVATTSGVAANIGTALGPGNYLISMGDAASRTSRSLWFVRVIGADSTSVGLTVNGLSQASVTNQMQVSQSSGGAMTVNWSITKLSD